jgi:hypothetical protein
MNDVARLLARSQLAITLLVLIGFFLMLVGEGMHLLSAGTSKEFSPYVGVIVFFWFQRQRPRSDDDPPTGTSSQVPTSPPSAAAKS